MKSESRRVLALVTRLSRLGSAPPSESELPAEESVRRATELSISHGEMPRCERCVLVENAFQCTVNDKDNGKSEEY